MPCHQVSVNNRGCILPRYIRDALTLTATLLGLIAHAPTLTARRLSMIARAARTIFSPFAAKGTGQVPKPIEYKHPTIKPTKAVTDAAMAAWKDHQEPDRKAAAASSVAFHAYFGTLPQLAKESIEDEFEVLASLEKKRNGKGYRSLKVIPTDWLKAHGSAADKPGAIRQWQSQMQGLLRVEIAKAYNEWKDKRAAAKSNTDAGGWPDEGPKCQGAIVSGVGARVALTVQTSPT